MNEEEDTFLDEFESTLEGASIFDRSDNLTPIPDGFLATTFILDATPSSLLNWTEEYKAAKALVDKGYKLLFELTLDLFNDSNNSLSHQGRFQATVLAINEFTEHFLPDFRQDTLGIILHRSKKLFSSYHERDQQVDYLELLRLEIPDEIPCLLLYDCKELQDPFECLKLFALDRFSQFTLALANSPVTLKTLIWNKGKGSLGVIGKEPIIIDTVQATIGLLLPAFDTTHEMAYTGLKEALNSLISQNIPFKVIPESLLPVEWDGLDELIINKEGLQATTLRAIDGFVAAGGMLRCLNQNA